MAKDFELRISEFGGLKDSADGTFDLSDKDASEIVNFKITEGRKLKKREGYESVYSSYYGIRGIWHGSVGGDEIYAVVMGNLLYVSSTGFEDFTEIDGYIAGSGKVEIFAFGGQLIVLTGNKIMCRFEDSIIEVQPYVPCVMTGTVANGEGTLFEEVNALTNKVKQEFVVDYTKQNYRVLFPEFTEIVSVKLDGTALASDKYYLNHSLGAVSIVEYPAGEAKIMEVCYKIPQTDDMKNRIYSCRCATAFGGANDTRAFLYGSPLAPAVRYHTGMTGGEPNIGYFPVTNYTLIGNNNPITSIVRQYDRQIIFTENEAFYSYLEYYTDENGRTISAFPVYPLSSDVGCKPFGQALLLENDPCTLTDTGLYKWITTNIRDERNTKCISESIAQSLLSEDSASALLFNRKGTKELFIIFPERIFVYNYGIKAFYIFEGPEILGMAEDGKDLYFYTADKEIYKVGGNSDNGEKIAASWRSKKFDLGNAGVLKNILSFSASAMISEEGEMYITFFAENEDGTETATPFDLSGTESQSSGVITKSFRKRLKRASRFSIGVTSDDSSPDIRLLEISVEGTVTDKKI